MSAVTADSYSQPALLEFEERLAEAGRGIFLFDYDGTLAPFAVDPGQACPYAGVIATLDALADTGRARIVVVTGRYLLEAMPVLAMRTTPEMWGSHGRERLLPDGRYEIARLDDYTVQALTLADAWAEDVEAAGGRVERKPGSIAFHWRGTGTRQVVRIRQAVTQGFNREALEDVLEICNFDGGIELRAPGIDKGHVVRTILAETVAAEPVVYLGDDATDEDAFQALRNHGLGVLVRDAHRSTAAHFRVGPPEGLLALLERWRTLLAGVP